MQEWEKFKVGTPASKGFSEDCKPFTIVSHTCHVETALSIFDRGEIRPYLVFDESKLNDQRILVSWLSPNLWHVGYRYGNICFEFDFQRLIEGKHFYWVESIAYKIPACRVLVTEKDHRRNLPEYDPTKGDGPWWYDRSTDRHYYNGRHCLEFMFEDAIALENRREIRFVDHHNDYCSIHRFNPKSCKELGFDATRGGALLIARSVATGINLGEMIPSLIQEDETPNDYLRFAFQKLCRMTMRSVEFEGDLTEASPESEALAQGICSLVSFHQADAARRLASLYRSEASCEAAIASVVSQAVGLDDESRLIGD